MSYYKKIEDYLKVVNDTKTKIEIDDIDSKRILFSVYTNEVDKKELEVLEEVMYYINELEEVNLTGVSHFNTGKERGYIFAYELNIGEDDE